MWSNDSGSGHKGPLNDIVNRKGQAIQVYVPGLYHGRTVDLSCSTIGGPSTSSNIIPCSVCKQPRSQVLRFVDPKDSQLSWTIDACNSLSCFQTLFSPSSKFSVGGNGVVTVTAERREKQQAKPVEAPAASTSTESKSSDDWGAVMDDGDDGNDTGDADLDELEKKLANMEATGPVKQQPTKKKNTKAASEEVPYTPSDMDLPWFRITPMREPPASRPTGHLQYDDDDDDDDEAEDDVGLATDGADKIQQMLAKYMEEEEDADLVSLLKQGSGGTTSKKMQMEQDERLTAEERVFRKFVDRIQRVPTQVLRCAPGGIPIWSIPQPASGFDIPTCQSCGKTCGFQFQVVPQILSVLKVDDHAASSKDTKQQQQTSATDGEKTETTTLSLFNSGGMNFGNMAIYSCSGGSDNDDPCANPTSVVVLQESVDEEPSPVSRPNSNTNDGDAKEGAATPMDDDDDEGWIPDE